MLGQCARKNKGACWEDTATPEYKRYPPSLQLTHVEHGNPDGVWWWSIHQ